MDERVSVFYKSDALIGEGPVYVSETNTLYWIDILGKTFNILDCETQENEAIEVPQPIGCYALGTDGLVYLMLQDGMYTLDLETKDINYVSKPDDHYDLHRFNDGKVDPRGRFFINNMDKEYDFGGGDPTPQSSVYFLDENLDYTIVLDKCHLIPNGMAWSHDHKKFYLIDSIFKDVREFDYDIETGMVSNGKVIIEFGEDDGAPDGMAIDTEGYLWIAHWDGSRVSRWDVQSYKRVEEIYLPAKNITSCVFGGKNMNELYLTSARKNYENDPTQKLAGSVFKIDLNTTGEELRKFKVKKGEQ